MPNPASSSSSCWSWLSCQTAQPGDSITQSNTAGAHSSTTNPGFEGVSGLAAASKAAWQHVHYASSPTAVRRRTNSLPGRARPLSSSGSSSSSGCGEVNGNSSGGGSSSSSAIHVDILVPGGAAGPSGKDAAAAGGAQCGIHRELELLKGVSGFAVPGKLMALMGGSGAGEKCLVVNLDWFFCLSA